MSSEVDSILAQNSVQHQAADENFPESNKNEIVEVSGNENPIKFQYTSKWFGKKPSRKEAFHK
ncbi:hypothetical protein SD81_040225, partial [Tolypothrix campylonemoides VB511288]